MFENPMAPILAKTYGFQHVSTCLHWYFFPLNPNPLIQAILDRPSEAPSAELLVMPCASCGMRWRQKLSRFHRGAGVKTFQTASVFHHGF